MVDARGYSCPIPVMLVKKIVDADHPQQLEILVDNVCAVENVSRFAHHHAYTVEVEGAGEDYHLLLKK